MSEILWRAVILGQPFSKANSRMNMVRRGRVVSFKAPKAQRYAASAIHQMYAFRPMEPLAGDLRVDLTIYYPSRRQDLDPSLIFDCLQKAQVIFNDRQLREHHVYWGLDKENPRVEIELYEV